ncbi:uncharacterized protein ASCRUDRAFT_136405 [Ascoidea rubescens DSM 1968]|uniref:Uncharacterized protein n=1 Tax=Ascoidea rubescens DSM 1968 TaxID=1344418 RepID=A0A1D2VLW2_9ASCO|nr:hypothetical protein ASCRUDRAFT_136405 [Ascoidea rubescens DSM 1968]ODV62591.1 hypothetical protein ASCRUDRAFT_136405 [Ascoidea rubescens DSM 1968]
MESASKPFSISGIPVPNELQLLRDTVLTLPFLLLAVYRDPSWKDNRPSLVLATDLTPPNGNTILPQKQEIDVENLIGHYKYIINNLNSEKLFLFSSDKDLVAGFIEQYQKKRKLTIDTYLNANYIDLKYEGILLLIDFQTKTYFGSVEARVIDLSIIENDFINFLNLKSTSPNSHPLTQSIDNLIQRIRDDCTYDWLNNNLKKYSFLYSRLRSTKKSTSNNITPKMKRDASNNETHERYERSSEFSNNDFKKFRKTFSGVSQFVQKSSPNRFNTNILFNPKPLDLDSQNLLLSQPTQNPTMNDFNSTNGFSSSSNNTQRALSGPNNPIAIEFDSGSSTDSSPNFNIDFINEFQSSSIYSSSQTHLQTIGNCASKTPDKLSNDYNSLSKLNDFYKNNLSVKPTETSISSLIDLEDNLDIINHTFRFIARIIGFDNYQKNFKLLFQDALKNLDKLSFSILLSDQVNLDNIYHPKRILKLSFKNGESILKFLNIDPSTISYYNDLQISKLNKKLYKKLLKAQNPNKLFSLTIKRDFIETTNINKLIWTPQFTINDIS